MVEQASGLGRTAPVAPGERRGGYATARDVEIRARNTRYGQDEEARLALDRLGRLLASGVPLRRDVPPGYHLDVLV